MRKRLLSLVVLTAILLGAGAAGTPVAGNDHPTAVTAGINLTTPAAANATARPMAVVRDVATVVRQTEIRLLVLLLAVALVWTLVHREHTANSSLLRWERRARRGPPALA